MRHTNREHQESLTRNERIGLWITNRVGTMVCAYIFAVIGLAGVYGAIGGNAGLVLIIGSISGYFLQLVLLPIIIVGTNVQSKHDQIQAEVQYEVNVRTEEAVDRIEQKLNKLLGLPVWHQEEL